MPSWMELNDALRALPPDGELGFESFVADLLRAFLKEPFYLARKGDQPSGDVYSPKEGIVVQAKRYNAASFSENEIIGEIHRAIESVVDLDIYVLVSTKPLGQLTAKLEQFSQQIGIDVIPITLRDTDSDLAALCVSHWQTVRQYFPELDKIWDMWAEGAATESNTRSHIEALRAAFQSASTKRTLANLCTKALTDRFSEDKALGAAVPREPISRGLEKWWANSDQPIAVQEGEEGTGKSWAAASFAFAITKKPDSVVFWLDSHLWTDAKTPERIVELCLENVITSDESVRKRFKRRIINQWTAPILVILDGANERSAFDAAESIVKSYRFHADRLHHQVRILFTTRPLTTRASTFQELWTGYSKIETVPFSMAELDQALNLLGADISAEELPLGVRELARIPRYLTLCVQLRKEVESFSHVTKELLLWVDLCSKVSKADPQIRTIEEKIAASPEALLSELARSCGWPTSDVVTLSKKDVTDLFPDFDSIRSDLIEQRIVLSTSTPRTVELSGSHVVLGWALWLRQLSDQKRETGREDLRNELLKQMEPAASNDLKARALQVASLLAFFDTSKVSSTQTRSLLLELWIRHHNAMIMAESLQFFVENDLLAYAAAIEGLFINHFRGYLETQLTISLIRIWRDKLHQWAELRVILERWLTLIFPGGREGSREKDEDPPTRFPVAASPEQLRLAYVAVSIISFRADEDLLESLLDSYLSQGFCCADVAGGNSTHRIPVKWCCEPLGYLMRWTYGETIIPRLATLISNPQLSKQERENIQWFARLLRQASLPSELGAPDDIFSGGGLSPEEDIENLEAWLSKTPSPGRKRIGFGSLGVWAIRLDVPQISNSGVAELKDEMEVRSANPGQTAYSGTWENSEFEDLVPWAAKLLPSTLEDVTVKMWTVQVDKDHFIPALQTLVSLGIAHPRLAEIIDDVLAKLPANKSVVDLMHAVVTPVTEMIMLHGTDYQITRWFHWLEDQSALPLDSPIVCMLPMPTIVHSLASANFTAYARSQARRLGEEWQVAPATTNVHVLAFWLETYAYCSPSDEAFAEWALELAYHAQVPKQLAFPLFISAARSTNLAVILRGLQCPIFQRYVDGHNACRWGNSLKEPISSSVTYSELQTASSFTVSGWILFNLNAPELQLWGKAVIERALTTLAPEGDDSIRCQVVQEIHVDGRLGSVSHERLPMGATSHHSIHSGTWGVDRSIETKSPTNEQFKAAAKAVSEEMDRRLALPEGDLIGFNAFAPLRKWCEKNKDEFCNFAFDYLKSFRKWGPNRRQEFANFASDVFIILLLHDPDRALLFSRNEFGDLHVVDSEVGLPWSSMVIWTSGLNHIPEIGLLRETHLVDAQNDEAILQHTLAARRGNINVEAIASTLLQRSQAKERALAVSLLAFVGTASAAATLSGLREEDQSLWVRAHARWAFEVCVTENHCQKWYFDTLKNAPTLSQLEARLVAMEPALSPTSGVWRHQIEQDSSLENWDFRTRGHLRLFWKRLEHNSFREGVWEILGRRLKEYCRGESLKEGVTSQQFPWWKPFT